MSILTKQIGLLLLVVVVSAALCSAVAFLTGSMADIEAVWTATLVTTPAAVFVLVFLFRYGTGPGVIIAATSLRFAMTIGLASYVVWKFSTLRTLSFFGSVTVVYLACLYVETWLVWKDYQRK